MGQVQTWQGVGPNGVGPNRAFLHIFDLYTKQRLLLVELPIIAGITTNTIIIAITQLLRVSQIFG